ncbi:MAG: glycosyltransferase family 39 protein [Thermonemataceae bacterium]|nr:glycosyltransferase family 39 protein [Thermonemataceae bacterium]
MNLVQNPRYYRIILLVIAPIFYFSFLGSVHLFDWDEINFAESAREMLQTGEYTKVQINYQPFWEKPPLFFWMQAMAMKIFGVNEFSARLPNAIFGILTLLTFYQIGTKLYHQRLGFIWALAYLGSFLPHLYFKSGIIDPVFNYFIFLGIYFLSESISTQEEKVATRSAIWAGLATGLAVLTKGPVGFLLVFLTFLAFWASRKFRKVTTFKNVFLYALAVLLVSSAWFGVELWRGGWWFFEMFINYQIRLFSTPDAGHEQPFYYHFLVVFLGCFPLSAFAIPSFRMRKEEAQPIFTKKMLLVFWIVMILFSIVKTKIVHYSSMAYLPLSFLAAQSIVYFWDNPQKLSKWLQILIGILGSIFSILLIALPIFAYNKEHFYAYIDDSFAVDSLRTPVSWQGWEFIIGLFYWLAIVVGLYLLKRNYFKAILYFFGSTALTLLIYTAVIVPKIEAYSQAPAINFYIQLHKDTPNSYVTTVWFKSYAQYFYFQYPKYNTPNFYRKDTYQENTEWLLKGEIDKDAYFVVKSNDIDKFRKEYPQISFLRAEGGFAFFKRSILKAPRSED